MADDRKNRPKDSSKSDAELTPLQRYLAKQKELEAPGAPPPRDEPRETRSERLKRASATPIEDATPEEDSREEMRAVPKELPPPPPPTAREPSVSVRGEPAGFFIRLLAYTVDTIILLALSLPVRGFMGFFLWFMPFGISDASVGSMSLGSFLAVQVVTFFYYGWFYREKGATPGKMLFGIEVRNHVGGARVSYLTAYLRESIGKYISSLILLLGYIIAFFREDGRALHDLIFGTDVVKKSGE